MNHLKWSTAFTNCFYKWVVCDSLSLERKIKRKKNGKQQVKQKTISLAQLQSSEASVKAAIVSISSLYSLPELTHYTLYKPINMNSRSPVCHLYTKKEG